ncbi:VOC family protein [bacterium AH-315-K03]|nr:VOC family protein [bacterium AH-315-K03]
MIGYVTLGTNDINKATAFYDETLSVIGASRFMDSDSFVSWSTAPSTPMLAVIKPADQKPATVGNGVMVALSVGSQENVKAIYAKALELGAGDEGEPGPRSDSGFYAAYFRDLDGNKLCAFCMG